MTDAIDVANGFDGSYNGGASSPGLVTGDGAAYLNSAARVALPAGTFLPETSDFSLVLWITPDNDFSGHVIIDFVFSGTAEITLFLLASQVVRATGVGAASASVDGTVPITPGVEHMVAFTRKASGETWKIYVDGALDVSQSVAAKNFTSGFGGGGGTISAAPGQPGVYDEVATFYSELTSGDIADLWAARGNFAAYSALVMSLGPRNYYHLDEFGPGPMGAGWYLDVIGMSS